jgi:uncharacterized membrane protein YccF (DUF307 family)
MTLILNILWLILGGFISGCAWLLASVLLAITIVGLPWAAAAWRIGMFSFFPFGKEIISRVDQTGEHDLGTGSMGLVLNIIWFVFAGWYIALAHIMIGIGLLPFIITIPFSIQHFKLALIALAPIGKAVVEKP